MCEGLVTERECKKALDTTINGICPGVWTNSRVLQNILASYGLWEGGVITITKTGNHHILTKEEGPYVDKNGNLYGLQLTNIDYKIEVTGQANKGYFTNYHI